MEEPKKSRMPLIVGLVLLLVFAGAYIFVLNAYKNESANRAAELTADTQKAGENRIDVVGRIVTVDPIDSDFLAFFRAEVIIALSLLSVVLRWIHPRDKRRREVKDWCLFQIALSR